MQNTCTINPVRNFSSIVDVETYVKMTHQLPICLEHSQIILLQLLQFHWARKILLYGMSPSEGWTLPACRAAPSPTHRQTWRMLPKLGSTTRDGKEIGHAYLNFVIVALTVSKSPSLFKFASKCSKTYNIVLSTTAFEQGIPSLGL